MALVPCSLRCFHWNRQRKARTLSDRTVECNATPERGGEATADRQAESGPAVLPRRRVIHLPEILEDAFVVLRRDADPGVGDDDRRGARRRLELHHQLDRALV